MPVLPLDLEGAEAVPGRAVIVLGYPAGLDLLLTRVDPALLATLVDREAMEITDETVDIPALLEGLSRLKQIRCFPTWGRLADNGPTSSLMTLERASEAVAGRSSPRRAGSSG